MAIPGSCPSRLLVHSVFFVLATLQERSETSAAVVQLLAALSALGVLGYRGLQMYEAAVSARGGMHETDLEISLWGTTDGLALLVAGARMVLSGDTRTGYTLPTRPRASPRPSPKESRLACFSCDQPFPRPVKFCAKCGEKQWLD
jgi:hypothetical protein